MTATQAAIHLITFSLITTVMGEIQRIDGRAGHARLFRALAAILFVAAIVAMIVALR